MAKSGSDKQQGAGNSTGGCAWLLVSDHVRVTSVKAQVYVDYSYEQGLNSDPQITKK